MDMVVGLLLVFTRMDGARRAADAPVETEVVVTPGN